MRTRCWLVVVCVATSLLIACGGGSTATSTALVTPATNISTPSSNSGTTTSATSTPATSTGTTTPTSGTVTTTSSSSSSVPSSATVFDAIQNASAWSSCSDCAGGGAITSNYWTLPAQTIPSLSGSSRQFFVGGLGWSNALWITKFGAHNSASHFLWDFYVYFDAASASGTWSAEYDLWQSIGGQKFMIGSQCVFGENHWDVWDSRNVKWVNTGVACPRFSSGAWHHIVWDVERLSATQYRYNTLFVDEQAIPINKVFDTEATDWADDLGVQWQLDQNSGGTPLNEWVDKVKLTIW